MDDGRWTMDDGRWTMDDGRGENDELETSIQVMAVQPPFGRYRATGAFGQIWDAHPEVAAKLGWATADEREYRSRRQRFEGGLMWQGDDDRLYVLYDDNTWQSTLQ